MSGVPRDLKKRNTGAAMPHRPSSSRRANETVERSQRRPRHRVVAILTHNRRPRNDLIAPVGGKPENSNGNTVGTGGKDLGEVDVQGRIPNQSRYRLNN